MTSNLATIKTIDQHDFSILHEKDTNYPDLPECFHLQYLEKPKCIYHPSDKENILAVSHMIIPRAVPSAKTNVNGKKNQSLDKHLNYIKSFFLDINEISCVCIICEENDRKQLKMDNESKKSHFLTNHFNFASYLDIQKALHHSGSIGAYARVKTNAQNIIDNWTLMQTVASKNKEEYVQWKKSYRKHFSESKTSKRQKTDGIIINL